MEENENPLFSDEINSQEIISNKLSDKKKLVIGIALVVLILVLIIVILIIASTNKKGKEKDKDEDEEEPIHDLSDKIGEIECIYTFDSEKETQILSNDFKKSSAFDIYIGDTRIKFTKTYQFSDPGEHKIKFVLFEDINMDYMFRNISSLLSIWMESNKNAKVISMSNTFENCDSLFNFQISGYNTKEIKSLKKNIL